MSESDITFFQNYRPDTLYVNPSPQGAYASLLAQDEVLINELEVTERTRLAVSAFYVKERHDSDTFKITKLKYHKTRGWQLDSAVKINRFELGKMRAFLSVLSSIDPSESSKTRLALGNIELQALGTLLSSSKGSQLIQELSLSPELQEDIYAVAAKKRALEQFEINLSAQLTESEWQQFFESNTWIFGHGLNYVFLDKVADKLVAKTTGATFNRKGKISDGLLRTLAEVSQFVLVEIKRSETALVGTNQYRPGCWAVSSELSGAVTQVQKTVFEFSRDRFREALKDALGTDVGQDIYAIEPRSYLVVGKLSSILGNDDKITCFELYRRNVRAPEILTFDELHQRAKCIVENISARKNETVDPIESPF